MITRSILSVNNIPKWQQRTTTSSSPNNKSKKSLVQEVSQKSDISEHRGKAWRGFPYCICNIVAGSLCGMSSCVILGAAHTSETNCSKHVAWNMKYLYDATNQYISMEQRTLWNKKCMFLAICFMKLIVLCKEMLRNFDIVVFFIDLNGKNTTNCLKYVSLMSTEQRKYVAWIHLWNMFHAICFIGVCHDLNQKLI